jgi:hypothetical protein
VRQRARNPKHWIDEVADVLCKSKHSIYKKIQGEVCLSFDEVITLASHYQMHLDPLIQPGKVLSFESPYRNNSYQYTEYLSHILMQITMARSLPDIHIWHTGIELPFMHDHVFPDLVAFKYFMHRKTVWGDMTKDLARFNLTEVRKDVQLLKMNKEVLRQYYQFPTTEIWNNMMLDITLSQIKYALQNFLLTHPEDALILCDALNDFISHAEVMAEHAVKFVPGDRDGGAFRLYHTGIVHATNVLLLKSTCGDIVYLDFAYPQFMYAHSGPATEHTDRWLNMLRSNATLITCEAHKERIAFFTTLRKKVARARTEIETIARMQEI